MLEKNVERKLASISFSNSTIQRQIKDLSDDIKRQEVKELKNAPFCLFTIQIDKSTDIFLCSQLMVFTKYIYNKTFKKEFLFCSSLETTTKAADILEKVSTFFQSENLEWKIFVVVAQAVLQQCWDATLASKLW